MLNHLSKLNFDCTIVFLLIRFSKQNHTWLYFDNCFSFSRDVASPLFMRIEKMSLLNWLSKKNKFWLRHCISFDEIFKTITHFTIFRWIFFCSFSRDVLITSCMQLYRWMLFPYSFLSWPQKISPILCMESIKIELANIFFYLNRLSLPIQIMLNVCSDSLYHCRSYIIFMEICP